MERRRRRLHRTDDLCGQQLSHSEYWPGKYSGGPGPRSPGGCARSPGSTGARWRKNCSTTPPAAHVQRPRLDYESHAVGLDRNELGALLVATGPEPAAEHALISLLALNGLRVSEAAGADVESLGQERGHRTLTIKRKGGKIVTIPLAPRTARAVDLAVGERCEGPVFLAADGLRLDRHGAARIVRRAAAPSRASLAHTCCRILPGEGATQVGDAALGELGPLLPAEHALTISW